MPWKGHAKFSSTRQRAGGIVTLAIVFTVKFYGSRRRHERGDPDVREFPPRKGRDAEMYSRFVFRSVTNAFMKTGKTLGRDNNVHCNVINNAETLFTITKAYKMDTEI